MLARLRSSLSPRWLAVHFVSLVLIVTMVLLGRWQLDVSNSKHFSLQNFGYALQWWAFSGFVIVMWVRLLRDGGPRARTEDADDGAGADACAENSEPVTAVDDQVAYRRYVMPSSSGAAPLGDATLNAYNQHLARLAQTDRERTEGTPR